MSDRALPEPESGRRLRLMATGLLVCCLLATVQVRGQDGAVDPARWNGVWVAQGTLFSVRVTVSDATVSVEEIESLGQVWSAQPGKVAGNTATIPVSYMGATANVLATLNDDGTAIVRAINCMPEFMVVCTLSGGRQATFVRVEQN